MISRRTVLGTALAGIVLPASVLPARPLAAQERGADPLLPLWEAWKRFHTSSGGRVIDRLQDNISHSEGQGYALLVAEALGDREGFELILDWTLQNLAVRDDALLAWRWHPADGGGVTDPNNASDGDIFAAWALLRAADRFDAPRYRALAGAIAADLVAHCLRPDPRSAEGLLLLPGARGFDDGNALVINPAYYMLRAMRELGTALEQPALVLAAADGNALLATLARERLVPDWVRVTSQGLAPAEGKSEAFGYEAMRVPLYLIWSRLPGHMAVARAAAAYRETVADGAEEAPVVIEPSTGTVRAASPDPGYRALAALSLCAEGIPIGGLMPAFTAGQPYYPSMLHLLSLLALRETSLGCVPR
jgi:endoglucanase